MGAVRPTVFALLCWLASPLMALGVILNTVHILFVGRPRRISGTAYEPFWTRHDLAQAAPDPVTS
jgi:hypothetical protein